MYFSTKRKQITSAESRRKKGIVGEIETLEDLRNFKTSQLQRKLKKSFNNEEFAKMNQGSLVDLTLEEDKDEGHPGDSSCEEIKNPTTKKTLSKEPTTAKRIASSKQSLENSLKKFLPMSARSKVIIDLVEVPDDDDNDLSSAYPSDKSTPQDSPLKKKQPFTLTNQVMIDNPGKQEEEEATFGNQNPKMESSILPEIKQDDQQQQQALKKPKTISLKEEMQDKEKGMYKSRKSTVLIDNLSLVDMLDDEEATTTTTQPSTSRVWTKKELEAIASFDLEKIKNSSLYSKESVAAKCAEYLDEQPFQGIDDELFRKLCPILVTIFKERDEFGRAGIDDKLKEQMDKGSMPSRNYGKFKSKLSAAEKKSMEDQLEITSEIDEIESRNVSIVDKIAYIRDPDPDVMNDEAGKIF
jgi:hypothetical protein